MKILVTGATGQLGWELTRALLPMGEVMACDRAGADLNQLASLKQSVEAMRPDLIVNAAAYTQVDAAEHDETVATRINAEAVGVLAEVAKRTGALLVHFSTDYVFDGQKNGPYTETDPTQPLNAYGRSKLAGEQAIAAVGADSLTFRTTWVYAARGKNFLRTMLRLAGERETLRVVADQFGAPTSARLLADWTAHAVQQALRERRMGMFESGIYNMTAAGVTTWHGFASAIIAGAAKRLPAGSIKVTSIEPIRTADYPVPARRPANSVLDNQRLLSRFGLHRPDWEHAMNLVLDDLLGTGKL